MKKPTMALPPYGQLRLQNAHAFTAFTALLSALVYQTAAIADPDVAVKKNADGTVEVSDAPSRSAKHAQHYSGPPEVHVIYRLKNDVGTRHINGVTVRTNPDGSIETTDGESRPEPLSHPSASHHSAHAKHPAPKPHK